MTIRGSTSLSSGRDPQSVAHKLLIELLSYQFAYPVRWINTQDVILESRPSVQRLIEIGPAKVLSTMAQKTLNRKFLSQDRSRVLKRQLLSDSADAKAIYYEYEESNDRSEETAEPVSDESPNQARSQETDGSRSTQPKEVPSILPPKEQTKSVPASASSNAATKSIEDVPLSATDVVSALVAQKFKQPLDELPMDRTIKDLSGGKSTLQNELIGDLDAEFGALPDDAESLSIQSLSSSLDSKFSGQVGKSMSKLISRLTSSKMPAGFSQAAIRGYLNSHWGLGQGRQTAIICFAVTLEPASRLADLASAKEFVDSVAIRYAKQAGIAIFPDAQAGGAVASEVSTTIANPASIEAANKEQKEYLLKQFEVLAGYLEQDDSADRNKIHDLEAHQEVVNARLDMMKGELDDDFIIGIEPRIDITKSRVYDSSWNWVREDLISLLNEAFPEDGISKRIDKDDRVRHLLNRWEATCEDIVKFHNSIPDSTLHPKLKSLLGVLLSQSTHASSTDPTFKYNRPSVSPRTTIDSAGKIEYEEIPRRPIRGSNCYSVLIKHGRSVPNTSDRIPYIHLQRRDGDKWQYHEEATRSLLDSLLQGCRSGYSFVGKTVLITGAGPNSIGAEVVKGLISGGADVIVTTSRSVTDASKFYNDLYREYGARGASLRLLPFNQGSKKDCEALIEYIYSSKSGLGVDLDFVVPFAAIPEVGREIDGLDSKSELAHRLMLTNLIRLLGFIKLQKEKRGFDTWPTSVILPLSPNHGTFGGDGLYAESKTALESLLSRWYSESWSEYLTVCGAIIGWTRGTGLMSGNNIVAERIEAEDVITFSQSEMGFNILALMTPAIASLCEEGPIYADLNGGLQFVQDLKTKLTTARQEIKEKSKLRKALHAEKVHHEAIMGGSSIREKPSPPKEFKKRASLNVGLPDLAPYESATAGLEDLQGMVDLSRVVVVVGYSELGPWGNAKTRWDMEHLADFTREGYIEMAWIMGLVKHFTGELSGEPFSGWLDSRTQQPVHDDDFKTRYRDEIMNHAGIRLIEPEGLGGYDAAKKELLSEIVVEEDLPPFEASKSAAEAFKLRHGEKAKITPIAGSEEYRVQIGKGVRFMVPKAVPFDRKVSGQLPKGWDPTKYGVPEDIVSQIDPISVYALCCVSQALSSAGIEDPYELYKHIHVSELSNCLGTGAGGMLALRGVYRDRYLDRPVQSDIIQESYNNALGAWVNMLLMASAGPIKSPSGTCATAIESLDTGCEGILTGKVKAAIVGGSDDFQEEMSTEFGSMKATASSDSQLEAGRLPSEMSRPMTTSRGGFVESAGCGVQLIMNAELAIAMGLPIYAIVGHTQMAGDKIGRSVPAPGQGILTAAREGQEASKSPHLRLDYRKGNVRDAISTIEEWRGKNLNAHRNSIEMTRSINSTADCRIRDAQNMWFNDLRKQNPEVAPMRAAMATWGLTVDDIQVASLHGTSTKANDTNESSVLNQQMTKMGRAHGNPLLVVSQKYLTGHPKGAAGAWMLNGCLQIMQSGLVPGNRNGDNIDPELKQFTHLVYPTRTIRTPGVRAFMLTSFGFGQKGGLVVGIAPKYLFSAVKEDVYEQYRQRVKDRTRKINRAFIESIMNNSLVKVKKTSPWDDVGEKKVFLDPKARVSLNEKNEYIFA